MLHLVESGPSLRSEQVTGVGVGVGVGGGSGNGSPQFLSSDGATCHSHFTASSNPGSTRFRTAGFPGTGCADALEKNPDRKRTGSNLAIPESIAVSFSLILPVEAKRKLRRFRWNCQHESDRRRGVPPLAVRRPRMAGPSYPKRMAGLERRMRQ